jgi:hypothetical protein
VGQGDGELEMRAVIQKGRLLDEKGRSRAGKEDKDL